MSKPELQKWAEEKGESTGFKMEEKIYQANYYETGRLRNVILSGTFQGKPAVLKAYDDPRMSDEPESLRRFHQVNQSSQLTAPELYKYEVISPKKGWFIMERLPDSARSFQSPLDPGGRQKFLEAYLEYRRNFPYTPNRELILRERLSASEYHVHRINAWLRLADEKLQEDRLAGKESALDLEELLPRYHRGVEAIRKSFQKRKMIWCHGHFKPNEVFQVPGEDKMYVIDFGHTKMYPEGQELAFIIWADHIMEADWNQDYSEWRKGVFSWIEDLKPVAEELGIKDFDDFFPYCLLERVMGAILADVCASDRPLEEKEKRLSLLYQLFDELI